MEHGAAPGTYGLMAEFDNPTALVHAAERARLAGYRRMDAYSPIPIEELSEALGLRRTRLPLLVLLGGIAGCLGGYGLQYWVAAIEYPMNVAGRPFNSWPQFIPITFETTVLGAALTCFFAMWPSTSCRSRTTRCSTSPRSRARPPTASSCASRPTTRASSATPPGGSSRACIPWECPKLRPDSRLMRGHVSPLRASALPRFVASSSRWNRALVVLMACAALAGCRQDMHDAPSYDPLQESTFFADGQASRRLVANTVPRGFLREDEHLFTGKINGELATEFPMPVTAEVMARGQERFNVFCSPCHGRTGEGNGMIVQRGFRQPPSYHEDRLVEAPVGHFFDVMTNGFGAMQDYSAQVPVADRWAIAAYLRALQLSRRATMADVPPERRAEMDSAPDAAPPAGQTPPGQAPDGQPAAGQGPAGLGPGQGATGQAPAGPGAAAPPPPGATGPGRGAAQENE